MHRRRLHIRAALTVFLPLAANMMAASSPDAQTPTPLQTRLVHEQQYLINCDILKQNDISPNWNQWPVLYFKREGNDAFPSRKHVIDTLNALRDAHRITDAQMNAEFGDAVKLTRNAMGYCRDNRAKVEAQFAKDLTLETGAPPVTTSLSSWPNINGNWYRDGDPNKVDTIIQSSNGTLLVYNELTPREVALGKFTGPTTIVANWRQHPNDPAVLSNNNSTIEWQEEHVIWQRRPRE